MQDPVDFQVTVELRKVKIRCVSECHRILTGLSVEKAAVLYKNTCSTL